MNVPSILLWADGEIDLFLWTFLHLKARLFRCSPLLLDQLSDNP